MIGSAGLLVKFGLDGSIFYLTSHSVDTKKLKLSCDIKILIVNAVGLFTTLIGIIFTDSTVSLKRCLLIHIYFIMIGIYLWSPYKIASDCFLDQDKTKKLIKILIALFVYNFIIYSISVLLFLNHGYFNYKGLVNRYLTFGILISAWLKSYTLVMYPLKSLGINFLFSKEHINKLEQESTMNDIELSESIDFSVNPIATHKRHSLYMQDTIKNKKMIEIPIETNRLPNKISHLKSLIYHGQLKKRSLVFQKICKFLRLSDFYLVSLYLIHPIFMITHNFIDFINGFITLVSGSDKSVILEEKVLYTYEKKQIEQRIIMHDAIKSIRNFIPFLNFFFKQKIFVRSINVIYVIWTVYVSFRSITEYISHYHYMIKFYSFKNTKKKNIQNNIYENLKKQYIYLLIILGYTLDLFVNICLNFKFYDVLSTIQIDILYPYENVSIFLHILSFTSTIIILSFT